MSNDAPPRKRGLGVAFRIFLIRVSPVTPESHARERSEAARRKAEAMVAGLRRAGLKVTPQRVAIVRELAGDPTHPTAQELFERLRGSDHSSGVPSMSFATVYNTLDALARSGLCESLALAPGATRFDANMHPHNHAVCDLCGMVRDVPSQTPAPASASPSQRAGSGAVAPLDGGVPTSIAGFAVRAVEQIYRGVCAACREAGRPPQGSAEPSSR